MTDARPPAPDGDDEVDEDPRDDGAQYDFLAMPSPLRLATWAVIATLAVIAFSMFWLACETHYRACVEAVAARTANDDSPLARLSRQEGFQRCNRSPF